MSTSVPAPGNDSSGGVHGSPSGRPTSPGPNPDDLDQGQHADADRADRDTDAVPRTPRNPGPDPDDLDQ
jgi:hypothetical protein